MKASLTFYLLIALIFISCARHIENETIDLPAKTDLVTALSNDWELYMYVVATDNGYYYLSGPSLTSHSLYNLNFDRGGTYSASNIRWSGAYSFLTDSTGFILVPTDRSLFECTLRIDNISNKKMQISTPWVEVNPEKPGASDYERFIAYQAAVYLSGQTIDMSTIRSVKLQLRYIAK